MKKASLMRKVSILGIVLVLALSLVGCGQTATKDGEGQAAKDSGKVYTMRIGAATNNDSNFKVMDEFKKQIESKTSQIKVEIFPASQLGSNAQMLQGIQSGTIQGLVEPTPFLGGFQQGVTLINAPFMWPDLQTAIEILNGPDGESYRNYFNKKGIALLGVYPYGDRGFSLKFDGSNLDNFKGKKIRIMGAEALSGEVKAMGGVPIQMDVPELYTALQQGTIEGMGVAPLFVAQGKYYEVAKNMLISKGDPEITVFMVNKDWLNSLPEELRQLVQETATNIRPAVTEFAKQAQDKALKTLEDNGVKVIIATPEMNEKLKNMTSGLAGAFVQKHPDTEQIYKDLTAAINKK